MSVGSERGWVGWLEAHRTPIGGLVIFLVLSVSGIVALANSRSGGGTGAAQAAAAAGQAAHGSSAGTKGSRNGAAAGAGAARGGPASSATGSGAQGAPLPGAKAIPPAPPIVPGTSARPACTPAVDNETGVTPTQVSIGQIVTDSQNLPEQFGPAYAGLSAYVKLANDAGGICGRTLSIDSDNDNANPSNHNYSAMAERDFAFVANESLLDGFDYNSSPPFTPKYKDTRTGEYVPDVGGLALAYARSQSQYHAGVIGSVSPVLVGGGQFKYYVAHAAHPCTKAGVLYVVEPTGASQDQAKLGEAALAASWGGNFGTANVKEYSASLESPVPVYQGIVERMASDGVNCVFSYADLASNKNFVSALYDNGFWPPSHCSRGPQCFGVVWVSFSTYDPTFIADVAGGGEAAQGVVTFIPHLPLSETSNAALASYLSALAACHADAGHYPGCAKSTEPSTFSVLGFASGVMFGQALAACGGAPTRACVLAYLQKLQAFSAGGLLGANTPYRCSMASYSSYGNFCWKWIFYSSVSVQVTSTAASLSSFRRIYPSGGFFSDTLHVARGSPG